MVVPESIGHEKVCAKGCSPPHNTQRCVSVPRVVLRHTIHKDTYLCQGLFSTTQYTKMRNKCRELSQEELDLNLNSVYNVCDTWRLLHDS